MAYCTGSHPNFITDIRLGYIGSRHGDMRVRLREICQTSEIVRIEKGLSNVRHMFVSIPPHLVD